MACNFLLASWAFLESAAPPNTSPRAASAALLVARGSDFFEQPQFLCQGLAE
jgi:hypothetical protein